MRHSPREHTLLKRAKQYDEAALGELYDAYAPRIYAYVYRRVGDSHLAEDLVGDVFVRVVQAIRSERFWHTSFRAWLYRIAHNVVVDHSRRRSPILAESLDEVRAPGSEHDPQAALQNTLECDRLRAAIARLTHGQQQVLVLRFGEGLTIRETASVMNKTPGAVKTMQHRALGALRRILVQEAASSGRARPQAIQSTASATRSNRKYEAITPVYGTTT